MSNAQNIETGAPQPLNPQRIFQMAWGYAAPLMMETGVELGLFDALDGGSMSADELARKIQADPRGVRILLDGLTALELVVSNGDGRYKLTPEAAEFLVSSKPVYLGNMLRRTSKEVLPKWMKLSDVVRSGKPAMAVNNESEGSAFFATLVEAIFPMSYPAARALADHLLNGATVAPVRVLDLAAGSGVWGIALAERSPHVRVTAVDWPNVLPVTQRMVSRRKLAERFSYVAGDLDAADFGGGYQIATLGHILHSEGEERSRNLLRKTFKALVPGGTIAIAEMVRNDDRNGPPHALIFAVNMLVNTAAGDTFSFGQMSEWLLEAGFVSPRQLQTPGPSPLTLATKQMQK